MAPKKQEQPDPIFEKGLPANIEAEMVCLGCVLLNNEHWETVSGVLAKESFSLEKHRRIFERMQDIHARGERIDRVVLANELLKVGQLESVDGLAYLVSLDEGLPQVHNVESYIRIVKEKADLRALIFSAQRTIDQAISEYAPAQEIASSAAESLRGIQASRKDDTGRTPAQIIEEFPGGINAFLNPSERQRGLPTGLKKVDEMTDGLHAGELLIIGARPGQGKSSLALNICEHLCLRVGKAAVMFSLEMNAPSILTRMLCSVARVDQQKFRMNYIGREERAALQNSLFSITESKLRLIDKFGITMPEVARITRKLVKEGLCDAMVLDYVQLMAPTKRGENRNLEVSEMTRQLKILAGDCQIPIIALSQLSRRSEQRPGGQSRPQLSDLRESGSIEQDADSVWFIYREELSKPGKEELKGAAEILISKQRNGPIGVAHCRFLGGFTRFENKSEDVPQEENASAPEPPPYAPMQDSW